MRKYSTGIWNTKLLLLCLLLSSVNSPCSLWVNVSYYTSKCVVSNELDSVLRVNIQGCKYNLKISRLNKEVKYREYLRTIKYFLDEFTHWSRISTCKYDGACELCTYCRNSKLTLMIQVDSNQQMSHACIYTDKKHQIRHKGGDTHAWYSRGMRSPFFEGGGVVLGSLPLLWQNIQ